MFTQVVIDPTLDVGTVVSYDALASRWVASSNKNTLFGIVSSLADEEGRASVSFAGIAYARATRAIPDEGGYLEIENGGVYAVSSGGCGVIAPLDKNAPASRVAGDLIMIHLG